MELSEQVTSKELSVKLKELGVEQRSLFVFYGDEIYFIDDPELYDDFRYKKFSAFTVSELIEMLPTEYSPLELDLVSADKNKANGLAQMVIHLIERGIITLDK